MECTGALQSKVLVMTIFIDIELNAQPGYEKGNTAIYYYTDGPIIFQAKIWLFFLF